MVGALGFELVKGFSIWQILIRVISMASLFIETHAVVSIALVDEIECLGLRKLKRTFLGFVSDKNFLSFPKPQAIQPRRGL